MSKAKNVSKRVLSVILVLALMLTTFVTFNIGTLAASAQGDAITVTENSQDNVYFYVPEQIYLAPDIDSYTTQDRYNFQWYVDSVIDKNTHLATPRTGENSSGGNFYFYYENAESITLTFKYLNNDLSDMAAFTSTSQSASGNYVNQNSTIKLASNSVEMSAINTRTDVARTRYTVASNTLDTTVQTTGSLSPYLAADASGYYIEWTIEYVDGNDGITKAVRAYTYVYKPYVEPAGLLLRTHNKCGNNHFGQNISWISGFHSMQTVGSYYPNSTNTGFGFVPFSSTNPVGVVVGDLYAQYATALSTDGYFQYTSDNNGSSSWFTQTRNAFPVGSFNYHDNETTSSSAIYDNAYYTFGTAPTAQIMIDSSRYTNLNQIPNLSIGMMVTDDEASEGDGAWYVADMTGRTDSRESDVNMQRNGTSTGEGYWNNYGTILASQGTYASPVSGAETDGVKYNGRWNKAIDSSATSGTYKIRTGYFNHDGSGDHYGGDTIWNVSVLPLNVTINNKQALRDAYERATNAAAHLGLCVDGSTAYYNAESSEWLNYVNFYIAAGQLLANLDTMTTINVAGTNYTCDQLAAALNSALDNIENARLSSTATARFLALEKDATGNYVLKNVKNIYARADILDEIMPYEFGDNVTYTAPTAPGYKYIGYINGLNYSADANLGVDYTSVLNGTETTWTLPFVSTADIQYTLIYAPAEISSIVDTKDGIYNHMKTITGGFPSEIAGAGYPTASARTDVSTDFNYKIEGNDVVAWTTDVNTREQYMFLPFYVDTTANTEYRITYDVAGTDASNVKLSLINSSFTGGNGDSTSEYTVSASGGTFATNNVDVGRAYMKLELSGDARNGKTLRISNICVAYSDNNELYMDVTQGYPAVYSPATSAPKTDMSYTASDVDKLVVTTRYNTLTYDQHQMLPYYIALKPNCSYKFTYDVAGIDASKVKFTLYNTSFTGGNGSSMNYYAFDASGSTITVGATDDAVAQLRIDILDSTAGVAATITNLVIENLDSKTTVSGTLNQTTTLGIPVKEGYTLKGWTLKANSGGTPNGTVTATGNDRIYDYTFGSDIDIIEAEWEIAALKVIFRNDDGTVISEQDVAYGASATAPAQIPEKFGHTFAGWDTDYTNVTKHLIIEPLYTEKDIAVTVTAEDAEIFEGNTTKVTATFDPNEPEISAVEWKSSSDAIATVDANGVVTGVKEGTATITGTITYDGRQYSSSTKVKVNPVEVTGIEINTLPDKTQYFTGETFDPAGLTLTVSYNNGTTAVVSEGMTFNSVNTTFAGTKTVRVTYSGFTATFRVTVIELAMTEMVIVTLPDKTEYFVGEEEFDPTGIEVIVKYNNGDEEEVPLDELYFEGFDSSEAGEVEIVVYYEDFEEYFNVTIKALEITGMIIKTPPTKTTYFTGEAANYAGLVLTVTYSNGTTADITEGYTVTGFDSATAGTKTLTVEYEGKTATFDVTIKAIELTSIEIATPATKTEYFVGDNADYAGLTIKANYNNGTSAIVEGYNVTGFDSATAGTKTITVTYEGKTTTFNVTIKAIEVTSIEIATPATKTEYFVGDNADYAGLTIKANYNNGTSAIVEGYNVTGFDSATAGTKTITVTYEGKTTTFNVTIKAIEVTSIEIATPATKTEYFVGDNADYAGLTIKANYNNGTSAIVEGYNVTGFDSATAGTKTITVTYEGKTTTFNVTVKAIEVTSIEIATPATKTEYFVGDNADYAGLTIKANYNNGTSAIVEGYNVTGFDSATAGTKTITIEYEGKTTTFNVTVKAVELVSIEIATNPSKVEYDVNDVFDATGLTLTATYNNGTTATITEGYVLGDVDMTTAGTKTVTVTYEGKTVSFDITVNETAVAYFNIIGGASVKTQGGVNYIVGLQTSLTKAKFQSTYIEYENVKLTYEMTTSRYLGTGSTVTATSTLTGEVIGEYVIVIYGDVDGSATINARDGSRIAASIAGTTSLSQAEKLAANVEGARVQINAKDKAVIQAVVAGTMIIDQTTGKGVKI